MGTTLTGTFISQTFDALIKVTDNDNLTSTAKRLTDGLGNDSPLFLSTTKLGVGITPTTTFQVSGNSQLGGNLTVTGNLIVQGTTTTVDTDTLSVKDPLIIVGSDNTSSDAVDLGFYGVYDTSGSLDLYAGLFRDASDGKFHLFKDVQVEPTTTVNKSATGYTVATLVGNLEGTLTGTIASTTVATTQSQNDNSTKIATTAYVDTAIDGVDTLAEILANGNTTGATNIVVQKSIQLPTTTTNTGTPTDQGVISFGGNHTNGNRIFNDAAGGTFRIQGSDNLQIFAPNFLVENSNGNLISAGDTGVRLFYQGSEKLQITNTGISVTGGVTATGSVTTSSSDGFVISDIGRMKMSSNNLFIETFTNGTGIVLNSRTGFVTFQNNGTQSFQMNSSNDATFAGDVSIPVGKQLLFGGGSHTYISEDIDDRVRFFVGGAEFMRFTEGDAEDEIKFFENSLFAGQLTVNYDFADAVIRLAKGNSTIGNIDFVNEGNRFSIQDDGTRRLSIDTSGNIGIGTTSASRKLHVNGGTDNEVVRIESSDTEVALELKDSTGTATIRSRGDFRFDGSSGEIMRMESGGNVGIGTTSPSAKLHIETGSDEGIRIHRTGTNANFGAIEFRNSDDSATNSRIGFNANEMRLEATNQFRFVTNSSDRMFINSSGNVGIGTTSPIAQLHLNSSTTETLMQITNSTTGSAISDGLRFGCVGNNVTFINRENGSMSFSTNNTSALTIDNSQNATFAGRVDAPTMSIADTDSLDSSVKLRVAGNLQIGSDNSGGAITKIYESSGLNLDSGSASRNIFFRINGTEKLKIDTSGNVGISQTSPVGKIHTFSTSTNDAAGYAGNNFGIIVSQDNGNNAGDEGNGIVFTQQYAADGVDAGQVRTGAIIGHKVSATGTFGGGLKFKVQPAGANALATALTLSNNSSAIFAGTIKQTGKTLSIEANDPEIILKDTDEGTDDKVFRIINVSEELRFTARNDNNDANADGGDVLKITRSGNATFAGSIIGTSAQFIDTSNPDGGSGTGEGGSVIIEGRRDGTANLLSLRSRDASAPTVALPNGQGGILRFQGFDGTDFAQMGGIQVVADGQAVANGDAPSKMNFYTVPDGSETLTVALALDKSQNATFAGNINTGKDKYLRFTGESSGSDAAILFGNSAGTGGSLTFKRNSDATAILTLNADTSSTFGGEVNVQAATHSIANIKSGNNDNILFLQAIQSDNARVGTSTNTPLSFFTNSTERARIDSSGNVGIGITSPLTALDVIGTDPNNNVSRIVNIRDDRSYAADVGGGISLFGKFDSSGNYSTFAQIIGAKTNATDNDYSGYLSFKTRPNNALPIERMRIDSSGLVGIGTASPGATLEVFGTGNSLRLDSAANQSKTILFRNVGSGTAEIKTDGDLKLNAEDSGKTIQLFTEDTERARIDSSGNLLIGKTTNAIGGAGVVIRNAGEIFSTRAGDVAGFNRLSSDGNIVQFYKDGSVIGAIGCNSSGGNPVLDIASSSSTSLMRFLTSGSERMRIDASGNATFTGNISVSGTTFLDGDVTVGDTSSAFIGLARAGLNYIAATNASGQLVFRTGGSTAALTLDNSQNATFAGGVTITQNSGSLEFSNTGSGHGSITTGSSKDLNIGSGSGTVYINNNTFFDGDVSINKANGNLNFSSGNGNIQTTSGSTSLVFGTVNTERMRIHSSGNIGIGTTSPTRKLDIRTDDGVLIKGASGTVNGKLSFIPASGGRQYDLRNDGSSFVIRDHSASTDRMYFHNNGNIGIGTALPGNKLSLEDTSSDSIVQIGLKNDAREYRLGVHGGLSDSFVIFDNTASVTRFTIDSSGDVEIGVADGGERKLKIHGGASGSPEGGQIELHTAADHDSSYAFYRIDAYQDDFRIGRAGTTDITLQSTGNVLFAGNITLNSTVTLSGGHSFANDGNGDLEISSGPSDGMNIISNDTMSLRTGGNNQRMFIDNNGDVLVGSSGTSNIYLGNLISASSADRGMRLHTNNADFFFDFQGDGVNQLFFRDYDGSGGIHTRHEFRIDNGSITISGSLTQNGSPSDIKYKENIKTISNGIEKIEKLNPVEFDWNDKSDAYKIGKKEDAGFIAQEVQKVLPNLVNENVDGDLALNYEGIIPYLVQSIQELKKEIEILKNK